MIGADRIDFLHRLSTNDLTAVRSGGGLQTVLLNEKARIIDVVTVLEYNDHALLSASPGNAQRIIQWLRKYVIMEDVRFTDITESTRMVEFCGPASANAVEAVFETDVSTMSLCQHIEVDTLSIVRMPSFDEVSYWVFGDETAMSEVMSSLRSNTESIHELTEFEVETKRIMAGMGKFGAEYSDEYNPLEAGLLHLTSFTKGCYLGQEVVARLDSYNKVKQRVMGFAGTADVMPGDPVMVENTQVGKITSVIRFDSTIENTINSTNEVRALGYIRTEHAHPESTVKIGHNGSVVDMQLHLLPMVR